MPVRRFHAIGAGLVPPEVKRARDELARHDFTSVALLLCGSLASVLLLPTPFLLLVMMAERPATSVGLICLAAAAGLAGAYFGLPALRARAARGADLRALIQDYPHGTYDAAWPAAQELLLRLRGEDPHSEQAHAIYPIARRLVQDFASRERTASRGEDTAEHDARIGSLLEQLRDASAAHASSDDARLLSDLRAAAVARAEVDELRTRAAAAQRILQPSGGSGRISDGR